MTPWQKLNTFCTAARHESFKLAADELCIGPSAVSHQLRDLEAHLGVTLFERRTRKVVLTLAGRTLYQQVEPQLRAIEDVVGRMRVEPYSNPVHIKIPEFFASELLIPRMAKFSEKNQHIELRIETTRAGISSAPDADLAIVLSRKPPKFGEAHRLFPVRLTPASNQPLDEGASRLGRDVLNRSTLLVHVARPDSWQHWAEVAGFGALEPPQIIRLDSMLSLLRATEQGVGIGLLPMPLSRSAFETGRVHRMSDVDYVTADFYYLVAAGNLSPAAQRLMNWIREEFTDYA